ncbi:MAG: phosphoenolpyruvate synthase [Halobacteriovoraceae bacterium]|nr:phosphoenolpyruvate synthase [Halobacteriovoraceae bacterium]
MISFTSKAKTLELLEKLLKTAKVLPQIRLSTNEWKPASLKEAIKKKGWENIPLIVRSSKQQEDSFGSSLAGHFVSIGNLQNPEEVCKAVEKVISSYKMVSEEDQVFIQPFLQSIKISGVAFSKDPTTGAPYWIINYDDKSGSTNSITSGITNAKVYYSYRYKKIKHSKLFSQIIKMMEELENYFNECPLDVEFAITEEDKLFLLQVRPLIVRNETVPSKEHLKIMCNIENKLTELNKKHPYVYGKKSIWGIMPDWNPAEIIGVRPRPLALSLYKEIITDNIWAYQRDKYGYRNLRSFPLLVHLQGIPYIDVRVSFNSFIPSNLNNFLAEKLVNYYLNKLEKNPHLHDKVEFEIVYSCYTLDLQERLKPLKKEGFSQEEIDQLKDSLHSLTNRIIDLKTGLCSKDLSTITKLKKSYEEIQKADLDVISKIYWLLEDCKRYGTLPFAGIARSAFIAIQFLNSFKSTGILSSIEINEFLSSLNSICSEIKQDRIKLSKKNFLEKYGHLREGTYDITSPRYDEKPDYYFDWNYVPYEGHSKKRFSLTRIQIKQIERILYEHNLNHNAISFFEFIKSSIEGREYSKFIFTRNLSEVLRLIKILGNQHGFSPEECSYIDIQDIKNLYSYSGDIKKTIQNSIYKGKKKYSYTKKLLLPTLITNPNNIWSYNVHQTEPNYITLKKAVGKVWNTKSLNRHITGKIVAIPSADPGYDWIFSYPIAGFITMYGGVNSHMAIRSAELGIPAIIGIGEALYQRYSQAKVIKIDCENKTIRIIQ